MDVILRCHMSLSVGVGRSVWLGCTPVLAITSNDVVAITITNHHKVLIVRGHKTGSVSTTHEYICTTNNSVPTFTHADFFFLLFVSTTR